ncbi:MAG: hypothetical protein C4520_08775 [Candidatus Abyssobacteria bacterium SURF_5]|uniref:Zinc-regulated TonB-dependent outer membrane receptor n=1 Tax=Abyssobacteria bacterium (strain SURF_5) TaxID=2093360 RepID=A0A3A4NTI8_ABYX5|nr:MAG: hypothetical protein C4520_08775 [Candidatus Abyssubacteria bacterium SURF_5]
MRTGILFLLVMILFLPPARTLEAAQDSDLEALRGQVQELRNALEQFRRQHDQEVDTLEQKIQDLTGQLEAERAVRAEEPDIVYEEFYEPPPVYSPTASAQSLSLQSFNPDISVIGDFLAQYTSHENEGDRPDDEFIFRELEVNFSGVLDPFARADVTIAVEKEFEEHSHEEESHEHDTPGAAAHEHGFAIDLEEAYLTALTLPYGLQARAGRMREEFGKVNPLHLHALPWVDYPLMIQNYFGGHGLIGDGFEVSWLAPTDHYLELVYGVFNNSNQSSFAGEDYDDFAHLVHMKNLFEINESTTFELGATAATAPNDEGHGGSRTWLEGIDLTLRWLPPQRALYHGLTWQTEFLLSQKDNEERGEQDTWGMYSSLGYRFARRWEGALRYDYSEFPDFEEFHEKGYSAYLTFLQSEYVFWRLGYMFIDRNFADPLDEDEHLLWVQLNFGLGPHRAHEY